MRQWKLNASLLSILEQSLAFLRAAVPVIGEWELLWRVVVTQNAVPVN